MRRAGRSAASLHWLWAATTPTTTVYAILAGRGYPEAVTLLGENFAGVIVRDGWAPYRRFTQAVHQTCLAQYANLRNMPIRPAHARRPVSRAMTTSAYSERFKEREERVGRIFPQRLSELLALSA